MNLSIRLTKPSLDEFVTVERKPSPHCVIDGEPSGYPEGAVQPRGKPWIHVFHLQQCRCARRKLLDQVKIADVPGIFCVPRPICDELTGVHESLYNLGNGFGLEAE
jgi:hypothetical protein